MDSIDIIARIEAHAAATGLKPSTIGQMAVRNRRVYDNLRAGGDIQMRTASQLLDWMRDDLERRGFTSLSPSLAPSDAGSEDLPAQDDVGAPDANRKGAA